MASGPTPLEFRARFPEFVANDYPDALIERAVGLARRLAAAAGMEAVYWLTAHWLSLEGERNVSPDYGSGLVTSETVGPRTVSYMAEARDDAQVFYARTVYGRAYLALERRAPARVMSVRVY